MISIVCVYNNKRLLETSLLKSMESQKLSYELILLDNTHKKFNSAAMALNHGVKNAKGNYLMFIHQDYDLESNVWLSKVEKLLDGLDNMGVAGVAGKYNRNLISNIKTGTPPTLAGPIQIDKPVKVQTLDECLFIIPKKVFEEIQLDEEVCDNWHLYAADYCLSAKKAGYDVYVLPLGGYHESPGYSFSSDQYYSTLKKLVKKHKHDYDWIFTSTGSWSTKYPLFLQIFYQKIYYFLRLDKIKF